MKTFVLVSDRQSFAIAARELHLSSAAISKQLILLEKELGLQLMTRTTRHDSVCRTYSNREKLL